MEREHTFAADVAHGLRTPLAGIRSTIDVALTCDHQVDQCRESLWDCSEIVAKMQSLVGNLLMLARLGGKQPTFRQEQVVLADVIWACWRPLRQRAAAQGQTFENHVPDDQVILTDSDSVAIVEKPPRTMDVHVRRINRQATDADVHRTELLIPEP